MNFTFVFKLKNTGHAPALNVNIDLVMYNSGVRRTNNEAEEIQKYACASGRRITLSYASDTLFPDQPLIQGIKATVSAEEIRKSFVKNFVYPHLTGCITYLYPSDKSVHQTGFSFDIVGVDPITHALAALRTDQGDIPAGSYAIRRTR